MYLDTQGVTKGTQEMRRDFSELKKAERQTATETEKLEDEFASLQRMVQRGVPGALDILNKRLEQTGKRMTSAGKTVDTYATRFKAAGSKLKAFAFNVQSLGAILATGAIANSIKNQIELFDELQKTAVSLGTSIEFLSEMQYVAGQTSGLTEKQVTNAFVKMTRQISEAAIGIGEAKDVLEELGLDAQRLAAMGPEKAFYQISRAMAGVTSEHDRLRIATKLFGEEQARIHTTLALGSEAMNQQRQRAAELGRSLSTIDAQNMERANDAMDNMTSSMNAFSQVFAVNVVPTLTRLMDELTTVLNRFMPAKQTEDGKIPEIERGMTFGDAVTGYSRTLGEVASGNPLAMMTNLFKNMDDVVAERVRQETRAAAEMERRMNAQDDNSNVQAFQQRQQQIQLQQQLNERLQFGTLN